MSENGSGVQSLKGKTIHWHLASSFSPLEKPLKVESMPSKSHYSTKNSLFFPSLWDLDSKNTNALNLNNLLLKDLFVYDEFLV